MISSLVDCEDKLGWNPAYQVEILEKENAVYLFSERAKICLKGKVYVLLVPLLQLESYSADEIADQLSHHISLEMAYFALQNLETRHLIHAVNSSLPKPLAAYCSLLDIDEKTAIKRLEDTKVYVQDPGKEVGDALAGILRSSQIQVVSSMNEAQVVLMIVKDYLEPEIAHQDLAGPLRILFKPFGSTVWLGPLLGKDKPVCYPCIASRIKLNRLEETFIAQQKQLETFFPPVTATLEITLQLALNLAAHELLKWIITGKNERLDGNIITLDTLDLKIQDHIVPSITHCPHCRDKQPEKSAEIRLTKRKKDEHYRSLSPEETLKKYAHHISPITGFVKNLESSNQKLGSAIHVYHSGANWAVYNISEDAGINTFRNASAGKGTTEVAAKAGSLCESLERRSGLFQGNEPKIYATYQELLPNVIHPASLSLFSSLQYKNRDLFNANAHHFDRIQPEFPDEARIAWTRVWSLTEQCFKFVPTSYCYFKYPTAKDEWEYRADSNGCAAGNCLEEAILQGFFELVERDSVAVWWYNRLRYPEMDLNSFNIPFVQTLLEEYAQSDREIHVLDITSDLGIPTCVAISRLKNKPVERIYFGFGCHLDVEIALLRALTEMNQFFMNEPFWEKEDVFLDTQENTDQVIERRWMETATFENQPYLQGEGMRTAADYPKWKSSDLLEDIMQCRKIVESQGHEFLVLDQTREEIGLNVVRVIVPGLRHFWSRFAPGRLYEVPVKMGKLDAPLNESELNPIHMFL